MTHTHTHTLTPPSLLENKKREDRHTEPHPLPPSHPAPTPHPLPPPHPACAPSGGGGGGRVWGGKLGGGGGGRGGGRDSAQERYMRMHVHDICVFAGVDCRPCLVQQSRTSSFTTHSVRLIATQAPPRLQRNHDCRRLFKLVAKYIGAVPRRKSAVQFTIGDR